MIQRCAARFVLNRPWRKYHLDSITLMLTELQWPTLQTSRTNSRFILLYIPIHHHQLIPNQYLPTPAYPITRANHHFKFQHYSSRTTMYCNSCFPRTIPKWNLPSHIAESNDLNLFKHNLSTILHKLTIIDNYINIISRWVLLINTHIFMYYRGSCIPWNTNIAE